MKILKIKIDELRYDPKNARIHDSKNIRAIKDSLKQFVQQKPIVIGTDNIVIAGNGTLQAAKDLGWSEIDVVISDLSAKQAKMFGIADNRTAELASWDEDILEEILRSIKDDGNDFNTEDLGFDERDLEKMDIEIEDNSEKEAIEDDIPETPKETFVKLGDMFQLGEHRLLCGDCTVKGNVDLLLGDKKEYIDMVYCDPPYGMNLNPDWSNTESEKWAEFRPNQGKKSGTKKEKVINDDTEFIAKPLLDMFDNCDEIFLWGADYYLETIERTHANLGSWIVWDKTHSSEGLDKMFGSNFELCWSKQKHKRELARITWKSVFGRDEGKAGHKVIHPAQKPIKLAEWFFERFSKDKNNIILDLFLGSGSTLIACEKTGRKCFGMEIDPHYCQVILERWEKYSGKKAIKIEEEYDF